MRESEQAQKIKKAGFKPAFSKYQNFVILILL